MNRYSFLQCKFKIHILKNEIEAARYEGLRQKLIVANKASEKENRRNKWIGIRNDIRQMFGRENYESRSIEKFLEAGSIAQEMLRPYE